MLDTEMLLLLTGASVTLNIAAPLELTATALSYCHHSFLRAAPAA